MSANSGKRGLGRGLSSLIGKSDSEGGIAAFGRTAANQRADRTVPIELLRPNPSQPRRDFPPESMQELADSIARNGVVQPLIVRPDKEHDGQFEIVAGERRWRAAQIAQQHEVPVIVRELSDSMSLEIAIIENIQRADLNAIEEADAFDKLVDSFGYTQEALANALGKSRSYIANSLRLLSLPEEVQKLVRDRQITAGHARALVPVANPEQLAQEIVKKGLSVRQAETLAKDAGSKSTPIGDRKPSEDASTRELAANLSANLDSKVKFKLSKNGKTGQIMINFRSLDHLDEICAVMMEAGRKLRDKSICG